MLCEDQAERNCSKQLQQQPKPRSDYKTKQKKFTQQRSILKNSQDHTNDELEFESKKQLILRRRRLFSHYRQYEQWRRRQFSYDPSYNRHLPITVGQPLCSGDYTNLNGAPRRRRQYKRQYSCVERSREESRDSRESPASRKYRHGGFMTSDSVCTDSTFNNQTERISFEGSECGGLACQPLHYNSRHFHMLQEEHSASISERCTRSRINSAIFVSSEGKGFDSIEFLRRHGSQSVLCRKAKSAENITLNEKKKSFSNKRRWRTNESSEVIGEHEDNEDTQMDEMPQSRPNNETRTLSVLNSNTDNLATELNFGNNRSATVTTSNVVVGSISIEAPPAYLQGEISSTTSSMTELRKQQSHPLTKTKNFKTSSPSHDSNDTVEDLVLMSNDANTTRSLDNQRSTSITTTTTTNRSQSPTISLKSLSLKGVKHKINTLPMVSVSGPSPLQEEVPASECL